MSGVEEIAALVRSLQTWQVVALGFIFGLYCSKVLYRMTVVVLLIAIALGVYR